MKTLLIVYHSMTGGTHQMAEAAVRGAHAELAVRTVLLRAQDAQPDDVLAAVDLAGRYSLSMWDAMILRAAASEGVAVVWSEDLSDGQSYDGVEVRNPFKDA